MGADLALAEYQHLYAILMSELYKKQRTAKEVTEPLWEAMMYAVEHPEGERGEIEDRTRRVMRRYVISSEQFKRYSDKSPEKAKKLLADLEESASKIVLHFFKSIKGVSREEAVRRASEIREEVMEKYRKTS